jgi:hypothetical protein
MKRVCAWCGKDLGDKPEQPAPGQEGMVDHGICELCKEALLRGAGKAKAKQQRPMVGTGQEKVYHGIRRPDGCHVTVNGSPLWLFPHEYGTIGLFDWGEGSPEKSQNLAKALLRDYTGSDIPALRRGLVERVIANLPHDAWIMTGDTLKGHLKTIGAGQGARLGTGGQ